MSCYHHLYQITSINALHTHYFSYLSDMGNGQVDDSLQIMTAQQPALNTTNLISSQIDQTDLVLHIGDISYARGYASVVSQGGLCKERRE